MAAAKSPLYGRNFKVGHLELVSKFTVRNYIQKDSAILLDRKYFENQTIL